MHNIEGFRRVGIRRHRPVKGHFLPFPHGDHGVAVAGVHQVQVLNGKQVLSGWNVLHTGNVVGQHLGVQHIIDQQFDILFVCNLYLTVVDIVGDIRRCHRGHLVARDL